MRWSRQAAEEDRFIQKAEVENWKDKAMFAESKYGAFEEVLPAEALR